MSWSSPCLHQNYCIPLHPQFFCHAPRLCYLGTPGFPSMVQIAVLDPTGNWLVMPSGHRLWFRFWIPFTRCTEFILIPACTALMVAVSRGQVTATVQSPSSVLLSSSLASGYPLGTGRKFPGLFSFNTPSLDILNFPLYKANGYRRPLPATGYCTLRIEDKRRVLHLQMDCHSCQ